MDKLQQKYKLYQQYKIDLTNQIDILYKELQENNLNINHIEKKIEQQCISMKKHNYIRIYDYVMYNEKRFQCQHCNLIKEV